MTHTPGETPQDKLAAWAAMNGPEILMNTVDAMGHRLDGLDVKIRDAQNTAAEVALGLGQAVGAAILAHEEEHHEGDHELVRERQVGDWLQSVDEQLSALRGRLAQVDSRFEEVRRQLENLEYMAAHR